MSTEMKRLQRSRDRMVLSWLLTINNEIDDNDEANELNRIMKEARSQFPQWVNQQNGLSQDTNHHQIMNGNDVERPLTVLRLQIDLLETWSVMIRKLSSLLASQITATCDSLPHLKTAEKHLEIKEATNRFLKTSRQCSYEDKLSIQISKIMNDLRRNHTSSSEGDLEKCITRLERWIDFLSSYEVFVNNYNDFRLSVEKSHNVKMVKRWTKGGRHYRCYESTITYEVTETEEKITTSTAVSSSSSSTVTKRFVIQAVIDPRTREHISLQESINMGIVNQNAGVYINTVTGETKPIPVAMSEGLIIVELVG